MQFICPECKNEINLSGYPDLSVGTIVECGTCGITLEVTSLNGGKVSADVVDEGK